MSFFKLVCGFDRDGLPTGPTHIGCPHCGVGQGADHKFDCSTHQIKPRPLPVSERRVIAPDDRFDVRRNPEPTDLAD